MPSDLYVALSGQLTMEARLSTVADNVANMRTPGFRAEAIDFSSVFSETRSESVTFATVGTTDLDRRQGPVEQTGNPLDVAIGGDGWFGIETPSGPAYTRDGRFKITEAGDLVTLTGYPVLDDGGAPIAVNPAGGAIVIGADGSMRQNGGNAGVLGLFAIPPEARLTRAGDSAVLADRPVEPVADRTSSPVRQGYREGSNVNPIQSIAELITVQRAFEYGQTVVRDRNQTLQQAIRTLGAE